MRRIEALTANKASEYLQESRQILSELNHIIGEGSDLIDRFQSLSAELKNISKRLYNARFNLLIKDLDSILKDQTYLKDIRLISKRIEFADNNILRNLYDYLTKTLPNNCIFVFGSVDGSRVSIVTGVTFDLVKKGIDASKIIKEIAKIVGGSGGGRSDFAQAGGDNPEKLDAALKEASNIIARLIQ